MKLSEAKYIKAIERMFDLVKRNHGGCEEEDCSLAQMIEDEDYQPEEAIQAWAQSGAADKEFNKLYDKYGARLEQELRDEK